MESARSLFIPTTILSAFVVVFSLNAAAQSKMATARITQDVDEGNLVTLRGHTHPLARPEFDQGVAPDNLPMDRILLVLRRSAEQEKALQDFLDGQHVASSPNYHRWLTPEDFGKQFGPAESDLQAVTDWLTTRGFQVNRVAAGRAVIEFSGSAGLIRQALHTEMHKYRVNGQEQWANAGDPQIPLALSPVVAGFASLNNFPRKPQHHRLGTFSRSKLTGQVTPEVTFNVASGTFYGVGPTDFATIYHVLPLWQSGIDGTGQTIAIVGETNIKIQDIRNFRSLFGLPAHDPTIILDGPDPGITSVGEEVEADLDVEWSGAVARGATIDLVISASTETTAGIDLSALYIVDNNLAPIMSESYGICEVDLGVAGNAFESALRQQAAAQGITFINSSGDHGSARCDPFYEGQVAADRGLAVSGLASTPYNVAVGGTDFDDVPSGSLYWNSTNASLTQSSAKSYIPETTWNDSCAAAGLNGCISGASNTGLDLVAGGGGPSSCAIMSGTDPNGTCISGYAKPPWQTGAGVPNDGVRDIPDISLFAADGIHRNFYIFCTSDANQDTNSSCDLNSPYTNFEAGGGTSFGAPAFAGIMALVNQKSGNRQGNANYVLYPLAAQTGARCTSNVAAITNSSCIFYDVIKGNNSVACEANHPNCSVPAGSFFGVLVDPKNTTLPAWTTTAGYDLATGLGTLNVANLVNKWSSVSFKPTTATLSLSTTPATNPIILRHGQPVNVNVSVSSTSGTPTGQIALLAGPGKSGVADFTLAEGVASGTINSLPGGTYNVTAHYGGDGTFGASDSTPTIQVSVNTEISNSKIRLVTFGDVNGAILDSNATTATYGSPYIMRVDVVNGSGKSCASSSLITAYGCPTGSVVLTDNGAPLDAGAYALNSQGFTEDIPIQLTGGTHLVQAQYSGDSSYNASTGSTSIVITPAYVRGGILSLAGCCKVNSPFTIFTMVSAQGTGAIPSGTINFYSDGVQLPGNVTLTSVPGAYGSYPYVHAMLQASLSTSISSSGYHLLNFSYSGDSNYAPASTIGTSYDFTYVPTITVFATPTIVVAGTSVTVTALVDTTNKNLTPTGQIYFYGAPSGYSPLTPTTGQSGNSAAQATMVYTPVGLGNSIFAQYPGDVNYSFAQSADVVSIVVFPAGTGPDFMLQSQDSSVFINAPGQSASTPISIIPTPGTNVPVALTCSVPSSMAEATCTFSPNSLSLTDQKISTAQLTVTTTAPHSMGALLGHPNWRGGGGAILVCILFFFVPMLRRRPGLLPAVLLMAFLVVSAMSCGGGGGGYGGGGGGGSTTDPGTQPGIYSITVTATSTIGGTAVTHTTVRNFILQP